MSILPHVTKTSKMGPWVDFESLPRPGDRQEAQTPSLLIFPAVLSISMNETNESHDRNDICR
jgi:hypothetical protein